MRARFYKKVGKGLYLGSSFFIGGIFYTFFMILGFLFFALVIYYFWG